MLIQEERIQEVLDRDMDALFAMLEVGERLIYINNTVFLSNGTSYPNIICLTVENRIQTKTISGSSTGFYGGFGKPFNRLNSWNIVCCSSNCGV